MSLRGSIDGGKSDRMSRVELIEHHRLLSGDLDDMTLKVERLVTILIDLKDKYEEVKNVTCLMFRPGVIGKLLEEAVADYESSVYGDFGGNVSMNNALRGMDIKEVIKQALKKRRLMVKSKSVYKKFSNISQSAQSDVAYDQMQMMQLRDEIDSLQGDIEQRNLELEEVDDKLRTMVAQYKEAKNVMCCSRGAQFKKVVEEATIDCL